MMMYTLCVLFVHALLLDVTLSEYDVHKIHILIVDQSNSYHAGESLKLKDNLLSQAAGLKSRSIVSVEALHQTFPNTSYWTILPILKSVQHAAKIGLVQWVVLVQESSEVKVDKLLTVLASYASDQPVFLGHAVYDEQPTIVHHFAFHENSKEFLYPAGLAGIAFNIHLLEKLFCAGADDPTDIQFSTDPQHELALFIWKHGVNLTHCSSFCVNEGPHCAISPRGSLFTNCGESVKIEDIYFAVKTWSGNYETRLPVLLSTWLQGVDYQLYGDKEDVVLPVVVTGVPNTKTGHCAKTINILKSLLSDPVMTDRQWFVLVDDDTLVKPDPRTTR